MHRCKWLKGVEKNRGEKKGRKRGKETGVRRQREWEGTERKGKKRHVCFKEG